MLSHPFRPVPKIHAGEIARPGCESCQPTTIANVDRDKSINRDFVSAQAFDVAYQLGNTGNLVPQSELMAASNVGAGAAGFATASKFVLEGSNARGTTAPPQSPYADAHRPRPDVRRGRDPRGGVAPAPARPGPAGPVAHRESPGPLPPSLRHPLAGLGDILTGFGGAAVVALMTLALLS